MGKKLKALLHWIEVVFALIINTMLLFLIHLMNTSGHYWRKKELKTPTTIFWSSFLISTTTTYRIQNFSQSTYSKSLSNALVIPKSQFQYQTPLSTTFQNPNGSHYFRGWPVTCAQEVEEGTPTYRKINYG